MGGGSCRLPNRKCWLPSVGKVFNVGVPYVDDSVQRGWWRKENDGGERFDAVEDMKFLDLDIDVMRGGELEILVEGDPQMPAFVEDSSDGEDDGNGVDDGEDDEWGLDDDALVNLVHGGSLASGVARGGVVPEVVEPRHSDKKRRG